jgi:hypothetical protein
MGVPQTQPARRHTEAARGFAPGPSIYLCNSLDEVLASVADPLKSVCRGPDAASNTLTRPSDPETAKLCP